MAFDSQKPAFYTSASQVFRAVHLSERLTGIEAHFGKLPGHAVASIPRIRWEYGLGDERFLPPELLDHRAIYPDDDGENALCHLEEVARRECQLSAFLYAENEQALTVLLAKFVGALSDVLRTTSIYSLGSGRLIEPDTDAQQSWAYHLRFAVQLLITDTLPAAYPIGFTPSIG